MKGIRCGFQTGERMDLFSAGALRNSLPGSSHSIGLLETQQDGAEETSNTSIRLRFI